MHPPFLKIALFQPFCLLLAILPPYLLPLPTYPPIPHTPPTHPSCYPRNQNHGCLLCARKCSGSKFSACRGLPSKREARALRLLPELHQHLSCVVCPGSFAHVAPVGLVLFALSACDRAGKAESRGLQVLCPVECLRSHTPAKFNFARALTHHPLRLGLDVRGGFCVLLVVGVRVGFFVLLVVVLTPKNVSASAGPSRRRNIFGRQDNDKENKEPDPHTNNKENTEPAPHIEPQTQWVMCQGTCKVEFGWSVGSQAFYRTQNLQPPRFCLSCAVARRKRKQDKADRRYVSKRARADDT